MAIKITICLPCSFRAVLHKPGDLSGMEHHLRQLGVPAVHRRVFISSGDTANVINVTKINDAGDIGGNMVYLGNHSYSGSALTDINGQRILLNAVMMPAKDLQVDVTASSNSPVCPGDTIKLYGNIYGGFNFSWSGPNGFTSTLQNPTIPNATSAKAGTYTLTMNVPAGGGGCAYTYNTTTVVVTKPSLTTQTSQSVICEVIRLL